MRPLRVLAIYIIAVFIGGALLAPWLYWLAQHFAHAMPKVASSPLSRYVHRSFIAIALIGLWPLFKNLGATSAADLGLVRPAGQSKKIGAGFLLGFVSLAVVAGLALAVHARQFNESMTTSKLLERLLTAVLTAVIVAVIEEILFRGALFGALRKVLHWKLALLISSMVYAIMHFIESARFDGTVTWHSGLELLPRMFHGMTEFQAMVPGFFNLTLAGALLALAYQRTGNLYFSIGLHCGWIFWVKFYGLVTQDVPGANAWWWGTGKLINGWAALPVLAIALLVFTRLPYGKKSESPA
jgi:membrane protease YdiL (CAAX protease family)